jgi:hypothetical protein
MPLTSVKHGIAFAGYAVRGPSPPRSRHLLAPEASRPFFSPGAEAVSDIGFDESWQATRHRRKLVLREAGTAGMPERSRIFELAGPETKMPGFGLFLGNEIGQRIFSVSEPGLAPRSKRR